MGLFNSLLELFSHDHGPDRDKKRLLKQTANSLKANKNLFHLSDYTLQPAMGRFFYNIFITTAQARIALANLNKSNQLRNIVIDSFLSESLSGFTKSMLGNEETEVDPKELNASLKQLVATLENRTLAQQINLAYVYLQYFSDFVSFDYYFLVKRFDPLLKESASVQYKPKYNAARGSAIINELEEFLAVAYVLVLGNPDWERLFGILKEYRNSEIVDAVAWRKTYNSMQTIVGDKILLHIIQLLKDDPFFDPQQKIVLTDIVKPFITQMKALVEHKIRTKNLVDLKRIHHGLSQNIFGSSSLPSSRIAHYTQAVGAEFSTGVEDGFVYADALDVLDSYYQNYLQTELKELVDLLLLKGAWAEQSSHKDFSKAYMSILEGEQAISKFDTKLDGDGSKLVRLRAAIRSAKREKASANAVKAILSDINDEAKEILESAFGQMQVIGRALKSYIDDYRAQPNSEIINNWKEVEHHYGQPSLGKYMTEVYNRIYHLSKLIRQYLSI